MTLIRWQHPEIKAWPFAPLHELRDEVSRWLDFPLGFEKRRGLLKAWAPALDVHEDQSNVFVKVELPGMKREEIEVSFQDGTLTISGERRILTQHAGSEVHRTERFVGRFQRSLHLPALVSADNVKATYKNGILSITLPKAEEAKPRQIEVSVK